MWLLEASVLARLDKATMQYALDLTFDAGQSAPVTVLSTADGGKTAVIPVKGILTKQADPFVAFFFGSNTAYDDIIAQIALAENDSTVSDIVFDIDSPGGNVDGLFDTLGAIGASMKPKSVRSRQAQSAAFAIAAAAGSIVASHTGAEFGSIGVAVSMNVSDDVVTLTSTHAPEKRPDPKTEEGKASIVRRLDAIDDLFVGAISEGRGVSMDAVRQGYGRGATLLAGEAKQRGMIDGIAGTGLRVVQTEPQATADGGSEAGNMTLEELKAQHPAVYKEAAAEGSVEGAKLERERVVAHLKLAETGDLKTALEAIKSGDNLTQPIIAEHMAAAMNRRDVKNREDDNAVVEGATSGVKPKDDEGSFEKAVTDRFLELVGNGSIEAHG